MNYTIAHLISGDERIAEYYRRAVEHWKAIWQRPEASDVNSLAELLYEEQAWFEENCGGGRLSQEIMAVSGIGMLFKPGAGFGREAGKARMLYDAFQRSFCELEVSGAAHDMAVSHGLLHEVAI